jgi:hypothetical protein
MTNGRRIQLAALFCWGIQSSPLDGLHGAHRQPDLLPRPATKERGEGWGEGLPPVAYLADSSVTSRGYGEGRLF